MISILIPVFNYNIVELVSEIHKQLVSSKIPFELICLEDGSAEAAIASNKMISKLEHTTHHISKTNIGRVKARQILAENAQYHWLLFLDADVRPKHADFIQNYLDCIPLNFEAIYGGFAYENKVPSAPYMLRWTYGRTHEQLPAQLRNKKPYKVVISANFLITKALFLNLNAQIHQAAYGLDNFFGALLRHAKAKVLHIDNEVYHLGIEKSDVYLKKKKDAAKTLLSLYKAGKIKQHQNDLLKLFIISKRFGINYLFSLIYRWFGARIKDNLISEKPSIKLLQLYRISYMCHQDISAQ